MHVLKLVDGHGEGGETAAGVGGVLLLLLMLL